MRHRSVWTVHLEPGFSALTVLSLAMFVAVTAAASAQDLRNGYFEHEFWTQLEPMQGGLLSNSGPNASSGGAGSTKGPQPLARDQAITDILKEAQYVFSGMIYGFSFSYTPSDKTRGISESFELKPVAQIKWGDPHLKVLDTRVENDRLTAHILYTLAPFQERWEKGWDSNVYPTATGRGTSRYFLSQEQKMISYREAIKEAIRDYLRLRIYNKPKQVVGQLVFRGSPYTIVDAGRYVTTLTVKLRIDKIQPYTVF